MTELHDSLDQALRTISPGPAPVDAAVRRGRRIRTRRRLTAVAGVLAVAAVAFAGYPALTHKQAVPAPPVTRRHASVTDEPPGRLAASGVIATGTIHGAPWKIVTGKPGTHGLPSTAPPGQHCFAASGSGIGQSLSACLTTPAPTAAAPVGFTGWCFVGGQPQIIVGRVLASVRYVTVTLSDGTRLRLIPATVGGTRYVAFPLPDPLTVVSASAYRSDGQYLTAVPFSVPRSLTIFGMWQRPGQSLPPRITRTIATGDGNAWQATAYAGPWGTCIADTSASDGVCVPSAAPLGTQLLLVGSSGPCAVFGSARGDVSYVDVTLASGGTVRAHAVAVGRQKFFAFIGDGFQPRKWTAYNAAGKRVASGGQVTSRR
jgi:hypothetical protein